MLKPTVICLMGPTASGKSELAIKIAQRYQCEIISVDSALIYRGMDIGTAKPTLAEMGGVAHHLIDIRDPSESYSAADFVHDALQKIDEIHQRGHKVLLVGGTMLYFHALQHGLSDLPEGNPQIREQLQQRLEQDGLPALYKELQAIDPKAAEKINKNDPQRILRALEVFMQTDKPLSQHWQEAPKSKLDFPVINIALAPSDRAVLHERIAARFKQMLEQGFIDEVRQLYERGDLHLGLPAMRAVGYRQVWEHLAGNLLYQDMEDKAIAATRQLAKRQLTWLRKWSAIHWVDSTSEQCMEKVEELLVACDVRDE